MLMSNTWQPAVLNLLPFSSNDASDTKGPESLDSLYPPQHTRVFPVLAVTRRRNDERVTGPGARADAMLSGHHDSFPPPRAASERLSRAQIMAGGLPNVGRLRVKSEYDLHRSTAPSGGGMHSSGVVPSSRDRESSRDPATCSITNINERIMTCRTTLPAEGHGLLQGSRTRKQNHVSHFHLDPADSPCLAAGAPCWSLPKPSLASSMVAFVADSVENGELDAKHPLFQRGGLWRTLTATPGELDLMKHRSSKGHQTHQAGNGRSPGSGKTPRAYKLNVRDLPRSTTPLNDHDPDRLNMKQVIAFLQSKGASVADAVQLPTEDHDEGRISPAVRLSPKAGVARARLRKTPAAPSLGPEAALRTLDTGSVSPSSRRAEECGQQGCKTGASCASKSCKDKHASKIQHSQPRDKPSPASGSPGGDLSPRKRQQHQRPFRLHRFLTMVPAPNETSQAAAASADSCRAPRRVPAVSQPPRPCPEETEKHIIFPTHSSLPLPDVDSSATCVSSSDARYAYRLPSYRLGSQNVGRSEHTSDDMLFSASSDNMQDVHDDGFFDDRNAIRLPNVLVESDEERSEERSANEHKYTSSAERRIATKADSQTSAEKMSPKKFFTNSRSEHRPHSSGQQTPALNGGPAAALTPPLAKLDLENKFQNTPSFQGSPGSDVTDVPEDSKENVFPDEKTKAVGTKQLRVRLPSETADEEGTASRKHPPEVVTLSLRKERTRTRELTYMSEIAGNDMLSDDARVGTNNVRMSVRREDVISSAM